MNERVNECRRKTGGPLTSRHGPTKKSSIILEGIDYREFSGPKKSN